MKKNKDSYVVRISQDKYKLLRQLVIEEQRKNPEKKISMMAMADRCVDLLVERLKVKEVVEDDHHQEQSLEEVMCLPEALRGKTTVEVVDIWRYGKHYGLITRDGSKEEVKFFPSKRDLYEEIRSILKKPATQKQFLSLKRRRIKLKHQQRAPFLGQRPTSFSTVNIFQHGSLQKILKDDSIPSKLTGSLRKLLVNVFGQDADQLHLGLQWIRHLLHNLEVCKAVVFIKNGEREEGHLLLSRVIGAAIGEEQIYDKKIFNAEKFHSMLDKKVMIFPRADKNELPPTIRSHFTGESVLFYDRNGDRAEWRMINQRPAFVFIAQDLEKLKFVSQPKDWKTIVFHNEKAVPLSDLWSQEDAFTFKHIGAKSLLKWIYNLPEDGRLRFELTSFEKVIGKPVDRQQQETDR